MQSGIPMKDEIRVAAFCIDGYSIPPAAQCACIYRYGHGFALMRVLAGCIAKSKSGPCEGAHCLERFVANN